MGKGIELLNVMREYASQEYQDRIPTITQENIASVGELLLSADYQDTYNEFLGIIEKIALTIWVSRTYQNKLRVLSKGQLPIGATVEELAVEIAKGSAFDAEGTNALARTLPHTIAYYHNNISNETYKATISRFQVKTAFRSAYGIDRLISETVQSLYNAYEQDDYLKMKEIIGGEVLNAKPIVVAKPTDNDTGKDFVKALRNTAQAMTYYNTDFSPIGYPTFTPIEDQVLLVKYDILSEISVEVLASAFNRSDVDYATAIIPVDNFGSFNEKLASLDTDQSCYAILIDKNSALFYDMDLYMDSNHNGEGSFETLFLHVRKNYGFSHIRDLAVFVENAPIELASTFEGAIVSGVNTDVSTNQYKNLARTSAENMSIKVYNDGELASGTATFTIELNDGSTSTVSPTITSGSVAVSDLSITDLSQVAKITLTNIA